MCLDLLAGRPQSVSAHIKETRDTEEGHGEAISLQLIFSGGVRADIEISNLLAAKKRHMAVHFDRETLIYDEIGTQTLVREPRQDSAKHEPREAQVLDVPQRLPLDQVLIDFAAAIECGESDLAGLRLGVDVVDVLGRCQQALDKP